MSIELGALAILIMASLALVLLAAVKTNPLWGHWLTGGSLGAAFYIQCLAFYQPSSPMELLDFSPVNIVLSQLVLIIVLIIWAGFRPWLSQRTSSPEVFYLLLLWLTIGTLVMVVSDHFAIFFISLELVSLSLIGLIAYRSTDSNQHDITTKPGLALEAAIKYLILSAIASAFILLGFSLIYINSGSLAFNTIAITGNQGLLHPWFITCAIIFVLIGCLFKLSIVPCHLWFADVVQGASAPVAALVTTLTKLAMFVVLYRLFIDAHWLEIQVIEQIIFVTAISSMLLGNILALKQQNIYRLLAYSSIAHFGYLLILISLTSNNSLNSALINQEVLIIYLSAYLLALTGIFAILSQINNCDTLSQLQGLLWRQPCLATVFMLMILSLAGIPLTFGFVAKFYLVLTSVDNQQWLLLSALILGSIISMFYYFNLIINLAKPNLQPPSKYLAKENIGAVVINVLIILVIIGLGINPQPIAQLIQSL